VLVGECVDFLGCLEFEHRLAGCTMESLLGSWQRCDCCITRRNRVTGSTMPGASYWPRNSLVKRSVCC